MLGEEVEARIVYWRMAPHGFVCLDVAKQFWCLNLTILHESRDKTSNTLHNFSDSLVAYLNTICFFVLIMNLRGVVTIRNVVRQHQSQ